MEFYTFDPKIFGLGILSILSVWKTIFFSGSHSSLDTIKLIVNITFVVKNILSILSFWTAEFGRYVMGHVKRIWYLSPMLAAKVQASLRIRAISPEPSLLAHTSSESWGTFRQKARSLAPLNGWACAVKICQDRMLKDTNSLDASLIISKKREFVTYQLQEEETAVKTLYFGRGKVREFSCWQRVATLTKLCLI